MEGGPQRRWPPRRHAGLGRDPLERDAGVVRGRAPRPPAPRSRVTALGLDERKQVGVDLILVRRGETVRSARIDLELGLRRELHRRLRRGADRLDLIVVVATPNGSCSTRALPHAKPAAPARWARPPPPCGSLSWGQECCCRFC